VSYIAKIYQELYIIDELITEVCIAITMMGVVTSDAMSMILLKVNKYRSKPLHIFLYTLIIRISTKKVNLLY
jgi:hypothetical protein